MRRASFLAVVALVGCGPATLPDPRIVSVVPSEMRASDAAFVTVTLDAVLPFNVSYRYRQATVVPDLTLSIGGIQMGGTEYTSDGQLPIAVPSVFAPGSYDVVARLSDGRQAVAAGGFTVNPGLWPSAYAIDSIPAQRRGVPFMVTLRALGANGSQFGGTVSLATNRGQVYPRISGNFVAGVRQEQVNITGVNNQQVILTVTDLALNTGASNAFNVN